MQSIMATLQMEMYNIDGLVCHVFLERLNTLAT